MQDEGGQVTEVAARMFAELVTPQGLASAEAGTWPAAAWDAIEAAGLHRALVPEAAGGYGLGAAAALQILKVAGAHGLPLPLAETMLAGWLLAVAGIALPDGPLTVIPTSRHLALRRAGTRWHLSGRADRVPWGRHAVAAAVLIPQEGGPVVALVPRSAWRAEPGTNLAREPRDTLHVDAPLPPEAVAPAPPGFDGPRLHAVGAAMRSLQMAGALGRVLEMTVQYAGDRVQFGRPIGKFQAVQQNLAELVGAAAAAGAAADGAAEAVEHGIATLPIACAKIRAGEAAGKGAAIAHQLHGALGFTYEHSLHFLTKRLWSWRDEFGSEAEWSLLVGRHMAAAGPDRLWHEITQA